MSLLLKILNASAARRENYMLLGDFRLSAVFDVDRARVKELAKRCGEFRVERGDICARAEATNRIEPVGIAVVKDRVRAFDDRLVIERNPHSGRIVGDAVSKETRRRDADDREWVSLNEDRRADDGRISRVISLP